MQAGAATLENSMEVPRKTKNRTTLLPSNSTTRYLSKGYRCAVLKGHLHPNVYSSTINNSQSMERAQMSIDGWMDKEDVVCLCVYHRILLGNQKEWNWTTFLHHTQKINSKGFLHLNVKPETIKILEVNRANNFFDIGHHQFFLDMSSETREAKAKINY